LGDVLLRGLLPARGLRAVFARVTDTARISSMLHGCYPTSAVLLGQALAAGVMLGTLQKERARVNLQVECDGPVGGLLVDADSEGNVRGYVRHPRVGFAGAPLAGARAAMGGSGFLSVLRDLGQGRFYRGSVELSGLDLAGHLRRYFAESEQVATALDLQVVPRGAEPLGEVAGLLVQRLPGEPEEPVAEVARRLEAGSLRAALEAGLGAMETVQAASGEELELLAEHEVAFRCSCSAERARNAVSALGLEGIADVLEGERQAVITCEFCRQRYVVPEEELRQMAERLAARGGRA
jgi:molecular chaperone Hsp33